MKVSLRTSTQLALTLGLPLAVAVVGYFMVGTLAPSVIVSAAAVATFAHIAVTLVVDLQTIVDVEYEVYRRIARARQDLRLQEEEQANRLQLAATIHDTVINTLCAVTLSSVSGEPPSVAKNDQLRKRCQSDLELLQDFTDLDASDRQRVARPTTWTDRLRFEATEHAAKNDLDLSFEVLAVLPGQPLESGALTLESSDQLLDSGVYPVESEGAIEALTLAVREALTNVGKHSAAQSVRVVVDRDEQGPVITVTSAWEPLPTAMWQSAVEDFSLFNLGAEVETAVSCELSGDLVVTIRTCCSSEPGLAPIDVVIQDHVAIPLMRTINFWLTGLNIIVLMMFFSAFPWWQWLFAALLAVSVSMSLTNIASLARPVTPRLAALVVVSAAALTASPAFVSYVTTVDAVSQWWVLLAAALILVAAAWTLPTIRWVWATLVAGMVGALTLAAYQWVNEPTMPRAQIIGFLCLALASGVIIVLVSAKARAMTEAAGQRIGDELRRAAAQAEAVSLAELRTEVRSKLIGRCMGAAEPVLSGIATGKINASNPEDRQTIWLLERQLRSAISLGRELDPLSGLLFELLWQAHDRGIELKVNSYRGGLVDSGLDVAPIGDELEAMIRTCPTGTVLSVSTYETAEARRLLVIANQPGEVDQEIHEYELIA